jgi:hypothetical protein
MLELSADRGAKDRQRIANVRVNLESLTKVTRRVRGRLQCASSSRGTDKRKDRGGGGKLHGGNAFFSLQNKKICWKKRFSLCKKRFAENEQWSGVDVQRFVATSCARDENPFHFLGFKDFGSNNNLL